MENHEFQVVTVAQMKEIERNAAESGLSYYQMMENAGTAAVNYLISIKPKEKNDILIFCGKGNNGGDGFVAARKLLEMGADVKIVLADGEPKTEDASRNKQLCESLHIPVLDLKVSSREAAILAERADVILDAIYGTGFRGALNETVRRAAGLINNVKAVVFALDIPSGLNGDSGEADPDTVRADYTIAFHSCKPAHFSKEAEKYCGKLACADIGITI